MVSGQPILSSERRVIHVDTHRHGRRGVDWSIVAGAALCGALTVIMVVALMWPALEAGSAQRSLRPPTGAIARGLNAEWQRASHQQESQVSLKRDRSRQAGMNGEQPVESTGFGFAFQSDVGPDGRSLNEENPFE